MSSHELYMLRCLELAAKASGNTAPNPMVGAVLVHNDRIIGEGWHRHYGSDHAEVNCLRNVKEEDRCLIPDSAMYVNLEPCAHYGITPPCSERLVKEKVNEVYIANMDPFEKVSGKGVSILKNAGIKVETGLLGEEGFWLNRRFFCFHKLSRPYIVLKWAKTVEGYMAPADKSRFQITNDASLSLSHKWRTEEGAIMVGTTTALNDNPQLTSRLWQGHQPLRIVIDRTLKIPHHLHVYDEAAATWIINESRGGMVGNVHYMQMRFDNKFLDSLVEKLYLAKILSVIIEGGATLLNSFLSAGLWDEARVFTGVTSLDAGDAAPVLSNARLVMNTAIQSDNLQVFINKNSHYPYPGVLRMGL